MTMNPTPPAWAETILRAVLKQRDFATVSGDLLEEYRETVYPARGRARADRWYVAQVLGFALPQVAVWGALFGTAALARTALDWFVPTHEFAVRSAVSTYIGVSLLLVTGFWFAWRSGSVVAGTLAGIFATVIAALIDIGGALLLFALFHDPRTMSAIQGSGGLAEVFTLPIAMVVPGVILGTLGGALGAVAKAKQRLDLV